MRITFYLFSNVGRLLAKLAVLLGLTSGLYACATSDRERTAEAVTAPLADVNLIKADIPPVLSAAIVKKYQLPADTGCNALQQKITDFDAVLGVDSDDEPGDKPSLYRRGKKRLKDATFSTIQSTSESVIPFRGWVRKLSGAERHSRKVEAAIEAGSLRRAFLKGLAVGQGCSLK